MTGLVEEKARQESSTFLTKEETIIEWMKLREGLIVKRNAILDNPFKYFNPFSRKTLRKIDSFLDEIDLKIYELERSPQSPEEQLRRANPLQFKSGSGTFFLGGKL